ncbi:hypothetical protein MRX96_034843 [Rhipicephalus microplus]
MADQKTDDHDSLDSDCRDIRSRFPGLEVFFPSLGYSGFQLREITVPGEVSLVRVAHEGDQQELRSRDARLLFYSLLSQHRCVVGLDLDDALVEGSGLGRVPRPSDLDAPTKQQLAVAKPRQYIQRLQIHPGGLVRGNSARRRNCNGWISLLSGEVGPGLTDLLCSLLYEARLSTLSIQGLHFNEQTTELLLDALRANNHTR